MKFERTLMLCAMSGLFLLSACATQQTGQKSTKAEAAAAEAVNQRPQRRNESVDGEPVPTATPGAFWPQSPASDQEAADVAPAAKNLNTDGFDLTAKRDAKAELQKRVIERWALLINGKPELAFDYLTPGYRKSHEREKYSKDMASRPVRWFRATFDHQECLNETSCESIVLVDFKVRMSAGMGVTESFSLVREQWIAIDGVWYHLPTEAGG